MLSTGQKVLITSILAIAVGTPALADDDMYRRQAKRIHDRLTGVPPDNATLQNMVDTFATDATGKAAAEIAIQNPAFYNVTLKNWATPWTNEEQTVFAPLNDYTATVIGLVRDGEDFRKLLYDDVLYMGNSGLGLPAYDGSDNDHYVDLEDEEIVTAADIADAGANPGTYNLIATTQSSVTGAVTGLDSNAAAGIMTSRAASMAFYVDGTNRAMLRFTLMNHLCTDLEPLKDTSRPTGRIRQDVSRSPGGDSRIYTNACQGCHSGMDGLAGAYAHYEWDYSGDDPSNGRLIYDNSQVQAKYSINENTFKQGYVTIDESWVNYWRNGSNWLLGWGAEPNPHPDPDESLNYLFTDLPPGVTIDPDTENARGSGAKSLGAELAYSRAFAQCQVDKVFENLCLRDPDVYTADRDERDDILINFRDSGYDMREVFTDVAAYCKGG